MSLRTVLAQNFTRLLQKRRFVSLKEVTALNGGTNGTLDRIRRGASAATVDSLEQLAGALGVEPWHLLVPGFDPDQPMDAQAVRATLDAMAKRAMAKAAEPEPTYVVEQAPKAKVPTGYLLLNEAEFTAALRRTVSDILGRKLRKEEWNALIGMVGSLTGAAAAVGQDARSTDSTRPPVRPRK